MKAPSIKQLLLLMIAGSLILFLGGLAVGVWIARSKTASEEQEVNRRLIQQARGKFEMLSVDTNTPAVVTHPPSGHPQQLDPNVPVPMIFPSPQDKQEAQQITCVNNLKQIGLSFRMWAGDNGDLYPFNVSTNQGGTLELCNRGQDGLDRNAALHFQALSNELNTPKVLVCPKDPSKKVGGSFLSLGQENVYQLHTGTNLDETNAAGILIVCPVDGNTLYCDGHVVEGAKR